MSGLILFLTALAAFVTLAIVIVIHLARRPMWSRLLLVAILTRVFDRPQTKRSPVHRI